MHGWQQCTGDSETSLTISCRSGVQYCLITYCGMEMQHRCEYLGEVGWCYHMWTLVDEFAAEWAANYRDIM